MKKKTIFLISLITALFGSLYFAFSHELIIMRFPSRLQPNILQASAQTNTKKEVKLIFWSNDKWNIETTELIWSPCKADNLYHIINNWLLLLDEETIMERKVSLQAVLLSPSEHEAYLSFDRNPFSKECSTFEKWLWIESLLKTIRENDVKIQNIRFLVHHQPMHDNHLDFSRSWPITGFFEN